MCPRCYQRGGSLLHCLSTLTRADVCRDLLFGSLHTSARAVYFCCTGLGVTSTGRYPASCPVKPGLSSSAAFRHLQPRSPVLLNTVFDYTIYNEKKPLFLFCCLSFFLIHVSAVSILPPENFIFSCDPAAPGASGRVVDRKSIRTVPPLHLRSVCPRPPQMLQVRRTVHSEDARHDLLPSGNWQYVAPLQREAASTDLRF